MVEGEGADMGLSFGQVNASSTTLIERRGEELSGGPRHGLRGVEQSGTASMWAEALSFNEGEAKRERERKQHQG